MCCFTHGGSLTLGALMSLTIDTRVDLETVMSYDIRYGSTLVLRSLT